MVANACRTRAIVVMFSAMGCMVAPAANAQLKTEKTLSYEAAKVIATTAVETCQAKGYHVSVTIVNRDGETIAQLRGDDARPHTVENSRRKAYTANTFRTDTAAYAKRFNDGDPLVRQQATLPGVIALAGGLPIMAGDDVVGGAAVSGSPGGNDEICVQAGIEKAKDLLK
jgi:uncharacterized protein GlcG (DUF336 family)